MNRPTIADLAQAAGVSVSTVNRVLGGSASVRPATIQRVQNAAGEIGFCGLGTIEARRKEAMPSYRLGFLLQQSTRPVYQAMSAALSDAARRSRGVIATPDVRFDDDLRPEAISDALVKIGRDVDAVAIVAPDHPLISEAISALAEQGKPVFAYITELSAPRRAGFVGTDDWKLGRTAAWFITQTAPRPGKILSFIGNHRYRCQNIADASFRSYVRENAPDMMVLDAMPTHEEPDNAYAMITQAVRDEDDIIGLFIGGGGITGVTRALREMDADLQNRFKVVCRDIGPETRAGLQDGLITAALCLPPDRSADKLVAAMISALDGIPTKSVIQLSVPFEIITPENV